MYYKLNFFGKDERANHRGGAERAVRRGGQPAVRAAALQGTSLIQGSCSWYKFVFIHILAHILEIKLSSFLSQALAFLPIISLALYI